MAQRKKDKVRERILKTSMNIFLQKGFKETGIKEIASGCGISVGNVYKYFKNKADIYEQAITDEFLENLHDVLVRRNQYLIAKAYDENMEEFESFITKEYYQFFVKNQSKCILLNNYCKGNNYEKRVKALVNKLLEYRDSAYFAKEGKHLSVEYTEIAGMIIMSNVQLYIDVLKSNNSDKKKIKFLQLIDEYHIAGSNKLFKELNL